MKGRGDAKARMEALRARQRAVRAQLQARRASARGPTPRRGADPVRWALGALVGVLVLLLLLQQSCQDDVAVAECPPCDDPCLGEGAPTEEAPDDPVPGGRIAPRGRPDYRNPPPPPIPWLDELRLQVASRSPRLADCFVGAERPGALKWTATVQPEDGNVADAKVEPMVSGESLTSPQRRCVLDVLEDPPYDLEHGEERSTPPRVSIVIEF